MPALAASMMISGALRGAGDTRYPMVAGILFSWLVFVPLIMWDMRTLGRLHWATKVGGGLFALVIALQIFFLATPGLWAGFVVMLPGF